jgi:hypothetical protein
MFDDFLAGTEHIQALLTQGKVFEMLGYLYLRGGWVLLFVITFIAAFKTFRIYKVLEFKKTFEWVYLAIDVPKENEQTPRAVENIFAHLAGAHSTRDLLEKYWVGETQRWFSFEIVSVDGYIQFIVVTEKKHKDLVEASIYAQYPDAEITQIEDYCKWAPERYPHPEYKSWGVEFAPVNKDYTDPIKTWDDFEDRIPGTYKDPMAAVLENFTRIGKGEQLWFQILVRPIGQAWIQKGIDRANKIMGKDVNKQSKTMKLLSAPFKAVEEISHYAMTGETAVNGNLKDEKLTFGALILTPADIATVKAIGEKVSRIGYHTKIRTVYIAPHGKFNKNRVQHGLVGSIKQFTDELSNGLKPDTKRTQVSAHYFLEDYRKNRKRSKIVQNYKNRDIWRGYPRYILNVRELATLWHFPMEEVKTPALKRSEVRTSRPPSELPFHSDFEPTTLESLTKGSFQGAIETEEEAAESAFARRSEEMVGKITPQGGGVDQKQGGPPSNLPFVD